MKPELELTKQFRYPNVDPFCKSYQVQMQEEKQNSTIQ